MIDVSGTSLGSIKTPVAIPNLFGGGGGVLGIQGSSNNWYLDNLIDPSRHAVRMPDTYSKRTAVIKQTNYGTLTPVATTNAAFNNAGNVFSVTLNPFIGSDLSTINASTITTCVGAPAGAVSFATYGNRDLATLAPNIDEIRPVSAFLYISFVGDTISDGGQIAGALMPSGSMNMGALTPLDGAVSLLDIANLSIQPGAYTGPVKNGIFVRWQPEDERDSFMYTPGVGGQAEQYNFPKITVTGMTTQSTANIRWYAQVNYEFTTQSHLFPLDCSPIAPKLIWGAKRALQNAPNAVPNDAHASLWSRFLDWARGAVQSVEEFYDQDIKPVLGPALNIGSQIASVLAPEFAAPLASASQYVATHY
jgi:hypothetical protein